MTDVGIEHVEQVQVASLPIDAMHRLLDCEEGQHLDDAIVLRDAPIRSLDVFEAQGLAELRDGRTLFCREQGDRMLVLGAIPATKQCLECHGCHRGDLLGAFSYVLRKQ